MSPCLDASTACRCSLTLESFNYNNQVRCAAGWQISPSPISAQEVDMRWLNSSQSPLSLLKEKIVLPDFILSNYGTRLNMEQVSSQHTPSAATVLQYPAGIWNELTMTFTFSRRYGWYIFQAYIPTYLTIFIRCAGARSAPQYGVLAAGSASAWAAR